MAMFEYLGEYPLQRGLPLVRSAQDPTKGIGANYVSRLVSGIMAEAGVKGTAHALRHTFVSRLVEDGVDVEVARQASGHATLATLSIYAKRHRADGPLRNAMEREGANA
jgi:site-specific recombinase XerD